VATNIHLDHYPCIHPISQLKRKKYSFQKKKNKYERDRSRIEGQYLKARTITYHSLQPFSTHVNNPHAPEVRKSVKVRGEATTRHLVGFLRKSYSSLSHKGNFIGL